MRRVAKSAWPRDSSRPGSGRTSLEGFAEKVAGAEGFNIREAEPLVPILVTTRNSRYRIISLRWGNPHVLVQGGRFFPEPTEVRLVGSSFGGSLLRCTGSAWACTWKSTPEPAGAPSLPLESPSPIERDRTTDSRPH